MNEAPKKIWLSKDELNWPDEEPGIGLFDIVQSPDSREYGTPYIRADLVDELVEVIHDYMNIVHSIEFEGIDERAKTALEKIKEKT